MSRPANFARRLTHEKESGRQYIIALIGMKPVGAETLVPSFDILIFVAQAPRGVVGSDGNREFGEDRREPMLPVPGLFA